MVYKLHRAKGSDFVKDKQGKGIKHYAGRVNRIAVAYDKHGYLTGLTKDQERFFEKEMDLPEGTLKRNFKPEGMKDFYADWYLEVGNGGLELDDAHPQDALNVAILKQKENVATSLKEIHKQGVDYVLTSEDADAKQAIDERTWKVKAFAHLAKMTPEDMRNYLVATGKKVAGLSPDAIESKVGDAAESEPRKFMQLVQDPDLDLLVFVNDLLQYNVLSNHGAQIVDSTGTVVAMRKADLVEKFKEADFQPAYITYQKELKNKKKAK